MESARPARPEDLPRIAELAAAVIEELTPMRGGEIWARQTARSLPVDGELASALDDPDQLLVVGEVDGTTIGYAAVRIERLRDGGALAVLDDLYVEPDARGVGVGEAMMDQVVEWATAQGCIGIDSVALPGNRATKNFFESFGLVARAIVVHRPLAPEVDTGEGPV
ncbi:GNAT family N-acetyltransferase [Actinomarinicola tropica]|uniref:GNAT family N-acetyltransferase n=1 Tax=Actinomarinicola tropica TaxID=2789776 RepID=A0A5Q2RED6_9ACTN|nr:GNAT family N-acetyltransferase [Actinomarinicola tropica]QGG95278.1 GNAT family N-acetyltransferase [Actinomarinicola tropica]